MNLFQRLKFKEHCLGAPGFQAIIEFPNGYGASVAGGLSFLHVDDEHPYELAVLHNGLVCYDTPITDNVVGHLNKDNLEKLLIQISELPEKGFVEGTMNDHITLPRAVVDGALACLVEKCIGDVFYAETVAALREALAEPVQDHTAEIERAAAASAAANA